MVLKAILRKPWRSSRGKVYKTGTTFEYVCRSIDGLSCWYHYRVPNQESGYVSVPNFVFKIYTEQERYMVELRKKDREEFIKATRDIFII
jgi:hypothetical protein